MNITKKTAFGATAAAAALVVVGAAAPAMASDSDSTSYSKWSSYASHKNTETTTMIAPDVDVLGGDNLNGNALLSGNETPILSGNDTAIGNVSDVGNGNLSGNHISTEVSDLVDNTTHTSVSDVVDVSDVLGDIGGWVNLEGMFED